MRQKPIAKGFPSRDEAMSFFDEYTSAVGRVAYTRNWRWCMDVGEPTVLFLLGPWCQAARMEAGLATRIMRLSTSVAMAVSPCWAGKMRARSFGPMIAL